MEQASLPFLPFSFSLWWSLPLLLFRWRSLLPSFKLDRLCFVIDPFYLNAPSSSSSLSPPSFSSLSTSPGGRKRRRITPPQVVMGSETSLGVNGGKSGFGGDRRTSEPSQGGGGKRSGKEKGKPSFSSFPLCLFFLRGQTRKKERISE